VTPPPAAASPPPATTPPVVATTPPPAVYPPSIINTPPPPTVTTPPAAGTAPPVGGSDKAGGSSSYRIGAYAAFVVAGAAVVTMIPLAYYASKEKPGTKGYYTGDGCSGAPLPQLQCPKVWSGNTAPAVVFGVTAAAAAVVGGALLYLDSKHKRHATFL